MKIATFLSAATTTESSTESIITLGFCVTCALIKDGHDHLDILKFYMLGTIKFDILGIKKFDILEIMKFDILEIMKFNILEIIKLDILGIIKFDNS